MRASCLLIAALVAAPLPTWAQTSTASLARVRHDLRVTLDAKTHRLTVIDEVTFPADAPAEFLLHGSLRVVASEPAVSEVPAHESLHSVPPPG